MPLCWTVSWEDSNLHWKWKLGLEMALMPKRCCVAGLTLGGTFDQIVRSIIVDLSIRM